jgi:primosomal protein N' (replication factor Y)
LHYYQIIITGSPLGELTYYSILPVKIGIRVDVPLRRRMMSGVVISKVQKPAFKCEEIRSISDLRYSEIQIKFSRFISEYYFCSLGDALGLFVPFWGNANGEEEEAGSIEEAGKGESEILLSDKQCEALEFLKQHPVSLLFGDTGSGKTEIYMKYFEEVLQKGRRALFLMPEISLTPQMHKRLEVHFGDGVVMWHSRLTKKQKEKNLQKIYDGSAKIIAGPRSALFLPVEDLGVIVVDEEHDDSYKSSSRPRYNARDMAIYYARILEIPVVLGSATPSLTSYVKFPHFRLKGGHFGSGRRYIFEAHTEEITPMIEDAVTGTIAKKEQAMLFIPTRANFKYLICDGCGYTLKCPYCSVGMSVHRNTRSVKCHYCGYSERIPQQCPQCRSGVLVSSRLGTAEAAERFMQQHPEFITAQFDRDTVTTQRKLKALLKRFNDHEIDLLVGTQMLAKGHDYHGVTLAVVLGMDNILNLSDYRARERALSLLIQIAGRSGRKTEAKVLVQSFNREFFEPFVDNYEFFLDEEKEYRIGMYPPYKKLCRILFAHKNGLKAQEAMAEMVEKLKLYGGVDIVGFGTSPIEKIANRYRFQILLRADKSTDLIRAVKMSKNDLAEIDMDPIDFA